MHVVRAFVSIGAECLTGYLVVPQQGYSPFLPFGGFGPAQGMPPQVAQAVMQQQAAAAMFAAGQPGMPGFGAGPPSGVDPATAMRNMHFAQAMSANAAMMGFQVG